MESCSDHTSEVILRFHSDVNMGGSSPTVHFVIHAHEKNYATPVVESSDESNQLMKRVYNRS